MATKCPRCGNEVPSLMPVDAATQQSAGAPSAVCPSCLVSIQSSSGTSTHGSVLMAQERARENHKMMLWQSRVGMIKSARQLMAQKSYSDAAVVYEKYIRVLEVIFESGPGGLKPEHFKDSARTQELTVLASAYWDLVRIYDTSSKYGERMKNATVKLSQLLKYTPIYPDIIRKAEAFQKNAKNPGVIKNFLKEATEAKGRCFIATAAFGSESAEEVFALRLFRDLILEQSRFGKAFIRNYYQWSPRVAFWLDKKPKTRRALRALLIPVAKSARFISVSSCHTGRSLTKSSQHEQQRN